MHTLVQTQPVLLMTVKMKMKINKTRRAHRSKRRTIILTKMTLMTRTSGASGAMASAGHEQTHSIVIDLLEKDITEYTEEELLTYELAVRVKRSVKQ